ncbi:MAG: GTP-binding protein [Candidatus Thorarchaeota archaeon]|nr:GTP-binding protein [Candidatus Thorarchaeota archaeon]
MDADTNRKVADLDSPKVLFEIEDDESTSAIAVGDVTGSGTAELCTGGRDGVLRLYDANKSSVAFLAQHDVGGSILSIKVADANNDGQMELVIGRAVGSNERPGEVGTVQVFRYAPSGRLELLAEFPVDRFVTAVYVTDVTGDEKNEILVGGSDSTLRILQMDTFNKITEFVKYQLDDMPIAIGTCDVIGDEIEEIVTGNRDRTLRVFKVRDHSVDQIEVIELPSPVISVASGDVLGDRKMELGVVTHDGSVRIYRNEESKLDLFSKLEDVKALSLRIEEINADHQDEIVVATSDFKINFYSLRMADLNQLASVNIGKKILAINVGDAGGDGRKEVQVGISDAPLQVIEGLYKIIPTFEVSSETKTGAELRGKITVYNVSNETINGISGKVYWFPKDHMDVDPQQLRFDLAPGQSNSIDVQMMPKEEGTVIVRPIVLMWTDPAGQVRQVTTPETAILVEKGAAVAAPAAVAPVTVEPVVTHETPEVVEETPFGPVVGTGFGDSEIRDKASDILHTTMSDDATESLKAAEELLDQLFGAEETEAQMAELDDLAALAAEPTPAETVTIAAVSDTESQLVADIRNRSPKAPRPGTAPDSYQFLFKTMVIGEGAVGKTTLVNRYVTGVFERDYKTTIGSQFAVKLAHISPPKEEYSIGIKLQAWDVAGQARFKAVRKMYYSGAAGIILVFDVTRRRSFTELAKWVEEADESIGTRVPMVCVGNKTDLPDRAVPSDEAKRWAEDNGFLYMESSAKTGEGVADMFTVLADVMWQEARKMHEAKKKEH